MKIKNFISLLLVALVALPSLAFAASDGGKHGKPEQSERGWKFGHVYQELSVEARADFKAQLKALHEDFRAKMKALREEFYLAVKILIASFLDAETEDDPDADGS